MHADKMKLIMTEFLISFAQCLPSAMSNVIVGHVMLTLDTRWSETVLKVQVVMLLSYIN